MKRVLISMLVMLAGVVAFAGSPLKVTNSTVELKKFLKEQSTASLEINWKNAKYDNKKAASKEFGNDYSFIQKDCAEKFIAGFNAKSKGFKIETGKGKTAYKFVLTVSNLDSFVNVMGFGTRWEAKMWGDLKIVEKATGKAVAEIEIKEAEDGIDYVRREAFGKTFMLLGAKVAKLK